MTNQRLSPWIAFAAAALLSACGGDGSRSLLSVDVSLGMGVVVDAVEVTASKGGVSVGKQTFPWAKATDGVLKVGVYLSSGVKGEIAVVALGYTMGTLVASSDSRVTTVASGAASAPVVLVLQKGSDRADGGASLDSGRPIDAAASSDAGLGGPDAAPRSDTAASDQARADTGGDAAPSSPDRAAMGDAASPDATMTTGDTRAEDALPPPADAGASDTAGPGDAAVASWRPAENLEKGTLANSSAPDVAIDERGNVYVIWNAEGSIKGRRWDAGMKAWGPIKTIVDEGKPQTPRIGVDATGRVIVTYYQESEQMAPGPYATSSLDFNTWAMPKHLHAGKAYWTMTLAVARNGRARTAWTESVNNKATVWTSYYDGTAWSAATMLLAAENPYERYPKVVIDATGNGALMWSQPDMGSTPADSVWVSTFVGAMLATPRVLDSSTNDIYNRALSINPDGQIIAAWVQRLAIDNEELWAVRGTPQGTWQAAERVARGTGLAVPAIAIDRQSTATAAWVHYAGGRWNLHASRGRVGEAWSTPIPLETDNTATGDYTEFPDPEMAVDASGSVAVVWRKKIVGNTYGVYLRQSVGTDWQPEVRLSQITGLNAFSPRVALNDTGAAAVTFWFGDPDLTRNPDRWAAFAALRY